VRRFPITSTRALTIPLIAATLWMLLADRMVLGAPAGAPPAAPPHCPGDNGGLTLSPGFCATVFAEHLGHARHLVVAADGVVYVNTWSGDYYAFDGGKVHEGGFLVALKDRDGDGRADTVKRFGPTAAEGAAGGTGIGLYNNALYAEINDRIVRYALTPDVFVPTGSPEIVVSGLPLGGDHPMHPFVIDAHGNLFVDVGSQTNSCQPENRMPDTSGAKPCGELGTRGGIWRYDADKREQKFSSAERYSTGIRNGEGMDFDASGRLYVSQHGRDQLGENWPKLYTPEHGHELPAEEVVILEKGADYGWPECYFDGFQKKLVLAPEYGGDGGKLIGACAEKRGPVAFFPAHYAPNDLLIYKGVQFPAPYRGGAFIAFHGSWNRAPAPQGGYNIVYQPLADGSVSGRYIVFADGFAGAVKEPGRAAFRPAGLAVGPDGALYVSEDMRGRIWRITYAGAGTDRIAAAPAPDIPSLGASGIDVSRLPVPVGTTKEQVALGYRIFRGEVSAGTCSGCHGSDAKGSTVGSDLTRGKWLWGDGSLEALTATIERGVPAPKQSDGAMPPKGGAALSESDVKAVAAFVWAVGHRASGQSNR
jgi:glucose/arabinose dehydrogenase